MVATGTATSIVSSPNPDVVVVVVYIGDAGGVLSMSMPSLLLS